MRLGGGGCRPHGSFHDAIVMDMHVGLLLFSCKSQAPETTTYQSYYNRKRGFGLILESL